MSNPKWLDLPGYVSIKLVGIGMIAFGVWMYSTGQAITEDAVIPWILMMIFGPVVIAGESIAPVSGS